MLDKSVVNGYVRACARLAVVRREPCRLDDRRVADLSAFGGNNHVRAVDLLCVEPDIGLGGCLECEKVILTVVPADVDFKSVRRLKAQRRQSALLWLTSLRRAEISLLSQLLSYLGQLALGFGARHLVEHRVEVLKLRLALFELVGKEALGVLRLLVVLVVFLRVSRGRDRGVELYPQRAAVFVVVILNVREGRSALNAV